MFLWICSFIDFLHFDIFWVFETLQTSLLCILGGLAEGGSVDVAVSDSDKWHVSRDTLHKKIKKKNGAIILKFWKILFLTYAGFF